MVSWRSAQGTKNKKAHKVSTSPLRPEDTPFGLPIKFCMWAKLTDVINCAKLHLHWLSCFGAPGVRKSQSALCVGNRSYNSVGTLTCYTMMNVYVCAWCRTASRADVPCPVYRLTTCTASRSRQRQSLRFFPRLLQTSRSVVVVVGA